MNCACRRPVKFEASPVNSSCHVTTHGLPASLRRGPPQRQDWLTGGTGLKMNYSIMFTEVSFCPEISILLQIIRIIHVTIWIMPEFYREGWAVCLQGGKHNEAPTDKKSHLLEPPWGTFRPPPIFKRAEVGANRFPESIQQWRPRRAGSACVVT